MVALKHTIWNEGEKAVYFYDGELTAKDGVVEIPADRPEWAQRAWIMGYRLDPKTGESMTLDQVLTSLDERTGEENGTDSDDGGRTLSEDGVRKSKSTRRKKTS